MRKTGMKSSPRGFTLIELMVVIIVIAILAAVLIPTIMDVVGKSRVSKSKADLDGISKGFMRYKFDMGVWPGNMGGTAPLTCKWDGAVDATDTLDSNNTCEFNDETKNGLWKGPYLEGGVKEGTKRAYNNGIDANSTIQSGIKDPWAKSFHAFFYKVANLDLPQGGIVLASSGSNQKLETTATQASSDAAAGDDIVRVITSKVD